MKILTFTTLYPNHMQTRHGIFVEQRMLHFIKNTDHELRVIAPVPWFPLRHAFFGRYAVHAQVAAQEVRGGLQVSHPRYPVVPKIGMNIAPLLLAAFMRRPLQEMIDSGFDFDVIDAHFFYPDGVAAQLLGAWFNKPVVVTARGNDISLYPQWAIPRWWIRRACQRVDKIIAVCQALAGAIEQLGVPANKITTLRNGVDLERFSPVPASQIPESLKFDGHLLLSVGHHIERKGHHLIIEALLDLPDTHLLIAGDGPMEAELKRLAARLGVSARTHFPGAIDQAELPTYYSAANCLVLASSREGWANVLLEAMACDTPVVATAVWGTPEVVTSADAGVLIDERTPTAIAEGVNRLFRHLPNKGATRKFAEQFAWDETTAGLNQLLSGLNSK